LSELLHRIPFLRIFIPFALGILYYELIDNLSPVFYELIFLYVLLIGIYFLLKNSVTLTKKTTYGFIIHVFFFYVGLQASFLNESLNKKNHYANYSVKENILFKGYISDIPKKNGTKYQKTKIKLLEIYDGLNWKVCSGEVLAYLPKSIEKIDITTGITFKNNLSNIPEPKNPFEFNYKEYLFSKGIYHQIYLQPEDFKLTNIPQNLPITAYADQFKNYLLKILVQYGLSDDNLSVTSALLLGYDDEISKELLNAYSSTGTLHVLSVSGLHVGLVFLLLNFILKFPQKRIFILLKGILMLLCIWFYAALTGLSPSVIRSATMFSFVILGNMFNRSGNIYNTLLASAFIILLADPKLIFDIGFQLSYFAIAGIVFFYPFISGWFTFENKLIEKIWQTTAISISAQISTLPLSLFYFGQFPVLFFISNLIIIPLSYVVMFGAMFLVILSPISFIAKGLTFLLNFSVESMNKITMFLDGFSFLNISDNKISLLETLLFFLLIFFLSHFLIKKNYSSAVISFSIISLLIITSVVGKFNADKKITVYHLNNESGIDVFYNNIAYSYTSEKDKSSKLSVVAKPNRINSRVNSINENILNNGFFVLSVNNKKIGILNGDTLNKYNLEFYKLDCLVLTNNPYLKGLNSAVAKMIVSDGNNTFKTRKYIQKINLSNYWNTYEYGAFVMN